MRIDILVIYIRLLISMINPIHMTATLVGRRLNNMSISVCNGQRPEITSGQTQNKQLVTLDRYCYIFS